LIFYPYVKFLLNYIQVVGDSPLINNLVDTAHSLVRFAIIKIEDRYADRVGFAANHPAKILIF
jgi:hypothetical protein